MNQYIFIILICLLVSCLIINSKKINSIQKMENMIDCSLNDKTITDNPIFDDLKTISGSKFTKYILDYNNNVIDNKIILNELLDDENILKLQTILNSYRVFDPVYNIKLTGNNTIKQIKNIILQTIVLNHLHCFGDNDVYLFWVRLHLINKNYEQFKNEILSDPIIEMFNTSNNYSLTDDKKIISYYKHQQNIIKVLLDKHPIIKTLLKDYSLLYENRLHEIILMMMDYLINTDNKDKKLHQQLKDLYLDLRELILINQLMRNNPHYHFGYSDNGKTFIFNHKLLVDNHKQLYDTLMSNIDSFEKLFNNHSIAVSNKNIKDIFLIKLKTYLKYNGIKLENNNEFILLDINSINLKHLPFNEFIEKNINTEFINLLTQNKNIDNLSFRIKNSDVYREINNLSE